MKGVPFLLLSFTEVKGRRERRRRERKRETEGEKKTCTTVSLNKRKEVIRKLALVSMPAGVGSCPLRGTTGGRGGKVLEGEGEKKRYLVETRERRIFFSFQLRSLHFRFSLPLCKKKLPGSSPPRISQVRSFFDSARTLDTRVTLATTRPWRCETPAEPEASERRVRMFREKEGGRASGGWRRPPTQQFFFFLRRPLRTGAKKTRFLLCSLFAATKSTCFTVPTVVSWRFGSAQREQKRQTKDCDDDDGCCFF